MYIRPILDLYMYNTIFGLLYFTTTVYTLAFHEPMYNALYFNAIYNYVSPFTDGTIRVWTTGVRSPSPE